MTTELWIIERKEGSKVSGTYYKVLNADGSCCNGGAGKWDLPDGKPGAWRSVKGELVPCERGIHICRPEDLVHWLGPAIFEIEPAGDEMVVDENKVVVRKARLVRHVDTWNDRTARLFAADCAERVLPIFEAERPNDYRPRKAIEAARAFARGEIEAMAAAEAARAAAMAVNQTIACNELDVDS